MKQNNKISIKDLKIVFDEGTPEQTIVLDKFSKDFEPNKIHFVIGNSGSGKTTLLSHFNGLIKSKYGDITIGDLQILGNKKKIKNIKDLRKRVGMVFQFPEYQLFKDTIEKDIMFGPVNLGVPKDEAKKRARHYLNLLGLNDSFLERSPFNLSGGQKRRVALAGILAIEPDVLIFDEPTAHLDIETEIYLKKRMIPLMENRLVLFATHRLHWIKKMDYILVMNHGQLVEQGTYSELTKKNGYFTSLMKQRRGEEDAE